MHTVEYRYLGAIFARNAQRRHGGSDWLRWSPTQQERQRPGRASEEAKAALSESHFHGPLRRMLDRTGRPRAAAYP
eukprot:6184347-Pleurochrysis_carterae.AAC.7